MVDKNYDRVSALREIGSDAGTLGFLKPDHVGVVKYISDNNATIYQRGIGAPNRPTSFELVELMYDFYANQVTMDYALHGTPEQRNSTVRYLNSIVQPDGFWDKQIETQKKEGFNANSVAEKVDNYMGNNPDFGTLFNKEHVVLMPSGTPGFSGIFHSSCNPGDGVLMQEAFYNAYTDALKAAGVNPTIIAAKAEDNYQPPRGTLLDAVKNDEKIKVIVDGNENPSGVSRTNAQAMERALEWIDIQKHCDKSGREMTYMQDIVYHDMKKETSKKADGSEDRTENCTVARALMQIIQEGGENASIAEKVLKNSVFVVSDSKINREAPTIGGVIAFAEEKIKGLKGYFISNLLSVNKFFAERFATFLDGVVAEKGALVAQGKNPNYHGKITDKSQSYIVEQEYYTRKLNDIGVCFGALKEGETMTPQIATSAIYSFSKMVKLFENQEVPESIQINLGNDRTVSLRDFVLDDPNKSLKITNGREVCRLIYGIAAIDQKSLETLMGYDDVKTIINQALMQEGDRAGVRARAGNVFMVDDAVRQNVAGTRLEHMGSLAMIYASCRLMGMEPNKVKSVDLVDGVTTGVQGKLFSAPADPNGSWVHRKNAKSTIAVQVA